MDCDYASDLFSLCIDGMLDEAQAHALRLHLETCAACRREYGQLARMTEALRSIPEAPLPAAFDERLRNAVASLAGEPPDRTARIARRRSRRIPASVAAVFAIGLLSLFVYSNLDEKSDDPAPLADQAPILSIAEESSGGGSAPKDAAENGAPDTGTGLEVAADTGAAAEATESARADSAAADGDAALRTESDADSAGPYATSGTTELLPVYESYERPGYPARGTTTGAHRLDEKAIYDEMLKKKLAGWTYEIVGEEKRDGALVYRVMLFSNSAGMVFDQEIEIVASGNALEIHYATEFMGL
jgi:hypothetical protein